MEKDKYVCKLCNKQYKNDEMSEEHYPAKSVGNDDICPICGKEIKNKYTRVVGFLTNVKNWHKVRREQDFPNRQFYNGVGVKVS